MAKRGGPEVDSQTGEILASGATKKRSTGSDKLPIIDTHLPGVSLIVKPGTSPRLSPSATERLLVSAGQFVDGYQEQERIENDTKGPAEKVIKDTVGTTEGLRGIQVAGHFRLPVSVPETKGWNRRLLKKGTGDHYSQVVGQEHVILEVDLDPLPGIDPALLLAAFRITLNVLGVPEEQAEARSRIKEVILDVNEKALDTLQAEQGVVLPEGTITTKKGPITINQPTILREGVETSIPSQPGQQE